MDETDCRFLVDGLAPERSFSGSRIDSYAQRLRAGTPAALLTNPRLDFHAEYYPLWSTTLLRCQCTACGLAAWSYSTYDLQSQRKYAFPLCYFDLRPGTTVRLAVLICSVMW